MAFLLRSRDFNFMTDKTIMKAWKIISSLNRNGSIDMSKVKQFIQNVCALIKRFCIFSKRNTLYNPSHDASIQIFHLSYKAHDFFCFLLIFDHPWTLNSIMDEDNEKIKEQPVMTKAIWETFFLKRTFYETLMANKAMVNSKVN